VSHAGRPFHSTAPVTVGVPNVMLTKPFIIFLLGHAVVVGMVLFLVDRQIGGGVSRLTQRRPRSCASRSCRTRTPRPAIGSGGTRPIAAGPWLPPALAAEACSAEAHAPSQTLEIALKTGAVTPA
jgi:hypothetical protein